MTINPEDLFAIMADREQPADEDLPRTGVSLEFERILAPTFVVSEVYGTRTSTVILVDRDDRATFMERTFVNGEPHTFSEVSLAFNIAENRKS